MGTGDDRAQIRPGGIDTTTAADLQLPAQSRIAPIVLPSITRPAVSRARVVDLETRAVNMALIRDFVQRCEFELRVSGSYANGTTHQEVLGYLVDMDKNFAAGSKVLDTQILGALYAKFRFTNRPLEVPELKAIAAKEILARIIARFRNVSRDVEIASNDPKYTAWKYRHKPRYDTRVGIRTGELLRAVRSGRVRITYRRAA